MSYVVKKTSLSVLVPVYNEEFLVEKSLKRLFVLEESPFLDKVQIIVVDDCSIDNTPLILERLSNELPQKNTKFEWKFIQHETNRGKGKAVQTCLKEAGCEITIIHDADLEYHPKDILRMIPLFIDEEADAVYGSRFAAYQYRRVLMYRHELGNRFLTFCSNLISNLNLTDMETCYKAIRTELFKSIPLESNDFRIEPELTIKLAKREAKIFEVPINYSGRTYQEGKKINWKDGVKAISGIIKFGLSDDIFKEDEFGSKTLARLSRADKFNSWMADTIKPYTGKNILEIGAGFGSLTKKLIPQKQYCATDINPLYLKMIDKLKSDKPYMSVKYLDLDDISSSTNNMMLFDTVICLSVIEHIDDDERAVRNIADLLYPKGTAIILVPRGQWAFGSLDKLLGHKRRYSEESIRQLSKKAGLSIKKIISFNKISTIPWFINGKILKKKSLGFFQIAIMNLLTPVFKRIDKYLPIPSLSYIIILKKNL
jgi:glycosyltransferase involved in cell wall biosynthesis